MTKQPNSNIVKIDIKAQLSLSRLNQNKSATKSIEKSPKLSNEKITSKTITMTSSAAIPNTLKGSNVERVNSGLTRRVVNNASKLSSGSLTNHTTSIN
jgi:hypothetical protein